MPSHNQFTNMKLPGSEKGHIAQVKSQKLLGVTLGQELSFEEHMEGLERKFSKRIGLQKRIKNGLPPEERESKLYTATIKPLIMYGSSVRNVNLLYTSFSSSKNAPQE